MQTAGIPDAKALARRSRQAQGHRRGFHARVAMTAGDLPRQPCANRAITVGQRVGKFTPGRGFDHRQDVAHHLIGFFGSIERIIAGDLAELRLVNGLRIHPKNGVEVEALLLGGFARQALQ